jgi:hypothetical protein
MDLNYDENTRDIFYQYQSVSTNSGASGLNGLINPVNSTGKSDDFQYHGGVMVWSLGPDKKANPTQHGDQGENRDNVISWK